VVTCMMTSNANCVTGNPATSNALIISLIPVPAAPVAGTHIPSPTQIVWNWNAVAGATGYKWNSIPDYSTATDMGAITTYTENGLICIMAYTRYIWAYNTCDNSTMTTLTQTTSTDPPNSPTSGAHVASGTQIVWNWNAVSGATGYKWNTINDYASATDMGAVITKTETGLVAGATYTRYVWAYNTCGVSTSTTLNQTLPFFIGQSYGGGIIFYIDGTGQHGLISASSDQNSGAQWGCTGGLIGTFTTIGAGQANTTSIVYGCSQLGIAAKVCDDLVLNGYSDWFLPSKDELNVMYQEKSVIGGFFNSSYWSSSENYASYAWFQNFLNGVPGAGNKYSIYRVRAVRAF